MNKLVFEYLELDKIDISLSNARKSNLEEGLDDLAKSIKEIEVQQPIVVFRKGDRYELIIGQRRYLACKKLGLKEIPAIITTVENETEVTIKSFSENIHRLDLEYRDKMQVATGLLNKLGSIDKVAEHLGVTPQTIRNYLGFSVVPDSIKKMVYERKLSASIATRIAKNIPDETKAVGIAEKVKETPRSEDRRKIIDVAKENPEKSPEEVVKTFKEQKFRKVTIDLTPRVAGALERACQEYNSDREDITTEALEEWLKKRGFIE
jgi:ParB family chromosome partitioning protein